MFRSHHLWYIKHYTEPSINYGTINVVAVDTWAGMTGVCVGVVVQLCSFSVHHPFDCCWRAFFVLYFIVTYTTGMPKLKIK